jgi:hypothetical protein
MTVLGLYDDSRLAETPDILDYDCGRLGLYDDSRLADTPDILSMTTVCWACTAGRQRRRTTWGMTAFKIFVTLFFFGVNRKTFREYCGKVIGFNFRN